MPATRRLSPLLLAGAFAALTLGCSATPAAAGGSEAGLRSVDANQEFTMSPGDSVALPDRSTLRYVGVKSDSRCRPDVRCVWAGDAEVTFEWTAAGAAAQSFELHTGFADKRSRALGGDSIKLVSLARGEKPEARLRFGTAP
ncbi:hypothetical protein IP90_01214 [Luteimonas cucumeris]|uniref:Lipoprotein n=1 Tax=Luteimonas cucumeris TaxID=985012 RepID=A0A562L710_9GAMM|nr:hypothetical protein [Luteimonas cucumeris]TWI03413.1 hypothetical protein IP90_01214 [Luteimonas cucumeris]